MNILSGRTLSEIKRVPSSRGSHTTATILSSTTPAKTKRPSSSPRGEG